MADKDSKKWHTGIGLVGPVALILCVIGFTHALGGVGVIVGVGVGACIMLALYLEAQVLNQPTKRRVVPQPHVRRPIPAAVRTAVFLRDDGQCQSCGAKHALEIDHIIPLSRGGSNTEKNLQVLCARCNRSKGNRYVG